MSDRPVILITGTSRGIGRFLASHYLERGFVVLGCSRSKVLPLSESYHHYLADVTEEKTVRSVFSDITRRFSRLDVLVNNAGIASMNHAMLTPMSSLQKIFDTNVFGTFLFAREAAKLMQRKRFGRIVNFATVAVPLKLAGEAAYVASKAAVISLTEVLAREFAPFNITVNAVGPTPVETDLIRAVPAEKIQELLRRQAIQRFGTFADVANVVDFFIREESSFVTGQTVFLGGV